MKINKKRLIGFKDGSQWKTYQVKPDGSFLIKKYDNYYDMLSHVKKNFGFDKQRHILSAKTNSNRIDRILEHNADISSVEKSLKKFPTKKSIKVPKDIIKNFVREKYNEALYNYQVAIDSGKRRKKPLKSKMLTKKDLKNLRNEAYYEQIERIYNKAQRVSLESEVDKKLKKAKINLDIEANFKGYLKIKNVAIKYQYGTSPRLYFGNSFKNHISAVMKLIEKSPQFRFTIHMAGYVFHNTFFRSEVLTGNPYLTLDIILDRMAETMLRILGKDILTVKDGIVEIRGVLK